MTITLVPDSGSTIKNFQIITSGGRYDNVGCIFKQGVWFKGKLSGSNCTVTNYLDASLVNIRKGVYSNDLENGTVLEYVFPKSLWDEFISDPPAGIDSTKYTQVFANGVWSSTTSTVNNQKIKGLITLNGNGSIVGFTFSEV